MTNPQAGGERRERFVPTEEELEIELQNALEFEEQREQEWFREGDTLRNLGLSEDDFR